MAGQQRGGLIYGIGHVDYSLPITHNGKKIKEYEAWRGMLKRCLDDGYLQREPTYKGCIVSQEWTYYNAFYNWVLSQENYNKWKNGDKKWAIDKDIIAKGNKTYSDKTCFLVPQNINSLFTTRKLHRGEYPIGVDYLKRLNKFRASCMNPFTKKQELIGLYNTPELAFAAYKEYKENIIRKVANKEYFDGNITQQCYDAMLNYKVEIND
jgi:hypothetical protein